MKLQTPSARRVAIVSAITGAVTLLAFAGFFVWCDTWMAEGHSLGALPAMSESAYRLEAKGDLVEAEAVLRAALAIQSRRAFHHGLFGVDTYLDLDMQSQLSFVVLERGRRDEAEALHAAVLVEADRILGNNAFDAYEHGRLQSQYGLLLAKLGKPALARTQYEAARASFEHSLSESDEFRSFIEPRMKRLDERFAALKGAMPAR